MNYEKKNDEKNNVAFEEFGIATKEDVNLFIDIVWSWYNVKYPDSDLKAKNGIVTHVVHDNIGNNSEIMTLSKLCERISYEIRESLKCHYINNWHIEDEEKDNNYVYIPIFTVKKVLMATEVDKMCIIISDSTGKVIDFLGDNLLPIDISERCKDLYLKELLNLFKKQENENFVNIEELEQTIFKREIDIIIRNNIFKEICLQMFRHSNNNLEFGKFRAIQFLKDFGCLYNVYLNQSYLDDILIQYQASLNGEVKKTRKKKR